MPIDTLEPITGDPEAVAAAARNLQAVATEVEATSARLRALATRHDFWSGHAAVRAHARSITLPPKLAKVHDSYATAGRALRSYATALAQAQAASVTARRAASRADDDLRYARAAHNTAATHDAEATRAAISSGLPAPAPTAIRYKRDIADAEQQLRRAAEANAAAHDQQRRAARAAASALHEASREGIHNKPWWRRALSSSAHWAAQAWTDSLRHVAKAALTISALAGFAAIALALVGAAFPPLEAAAGVLESISIASGVVALMSEAVLAATGNASWKSVGIDSLAAIPGIGAAGYRALGSTLKMTRIVRHTASATAADASKVDIATRIRNRTGPIALDPTESWGNPSTLASHARRHAADFGVLSADEYARHAARFLDEGIRRRIPTKIRSNDGTIRLYDPQTNTFGAYRADGTTMTFFKPQPTRHKYRDNWEYWQAQPGKVPWDGHR